MYKKTVHFLRGSALAEVQCACPERVLNLLGSRGVVFWGLRWQSEICFRLWLLLPQVETLQEIGAGDKPVYLVFNKVDAYTYVEKDEDDLTPPTRENRSLDELKQSWIARANTPCIFLSARTKANLEKFRSDLYGMVREIHAGRYPFNNFLY